MTWVRGLPTWFREQSSVTKLSIPGVAISLVLLAVGTIRHDDALLMASTALNITIIVSNLIFTFWLAAETKRAEHHTQEARAQIGRLRAERGKVMDSNDTKHRTVRVGFSVDMDFGEVLPTPETIQRIELAARAAVAVMGMAGNVLHAETSTAQVEISANFPQWQPVPKDGEKKKADDLHDVSVDAVIRAAEGLLKPATGGGDGTTH